MRTGARGGYRKSGITRRARAIPLNKQWKDPDSFLERLKKIEERFLAAAFFAVKIVTILVVFVSALILEGGMVWHLRTIEFGPASSHPQTIEQPIDGARIIRL